MASIALSTAVDSSSLSIDFRLPCDTSLPQTQAEGALLTVTDVIPVSAGKEGVAAEALKRQPLLRATQQTLNQIQELTANFWVFGKLQKPLFKKKKKRIISLAVIQFMSWSEERISHT